MSRKYLVVVVGPTAVGKTALTISLARALNTEIISADSRQFYRELTIGTAKPTAEELAQVKHHFINSLSVTDEYNAGQFEQDVLTSLKALYRNKEVVLMTGGSGLFIRAVVEGMDNFPDIDPAIRRRLQLSFKKEGIAFLQDLLEEHDPVYYEQVDKNNPQRLMRALEVTLGTGKPYSSFRQGQATPRPFQVIQIGLKLPRKELYERINKRVDEMMASGLLEEVQSLMPYKKHNALDTVGYKELIAHLEGDISLNRAVELIKRNSRRFAKRQMTWFMKDDTVRWFSPDEETTILNYIRQRIAEEGGQP